MKTRINKKMMAIIAAMSLAAASVAGCGAGQSESKQGQASTDTSKKDTGAAKDSEEEKTEVRREDFPDCDGSGHGYREIYYSDGSMETEEY